MPYIRTHHVRVSSAALAIALIAASGTTAASAQEAQASPQAEADNAGVADIVVTAQFRSQRLQDTPIAITAVDAEMLESRSQTSLADVANQAPSVVLRPTTVAFGPSISATIRGLGQIDFNPALEPGVGLYIDDVYYPRLVGANFDLLDVERVEVLRGPQGTLTGRNSEGGAIKFISRRPNGENSGYLSATYGSRSRINLRGSADFKVTDSLFGRLSGTFADQKGYVSNLDYGCVVPSSGVPKLAGGTNCEVGKHGDVGYKAIRGILRYNPSDAIDVMLSGDYIRDSRNSSAEVLLYANNSNPNVRTVNGLPYDSRFVCGKFCNYSTNGSTPGNFVAGAIPALQGLPLAANTGSGRSEYTGWGTALNADFKLTEDVSVHSITAYRAFDSSFSTDGDLSPANVGFGISDLTSWFASQELRLNAKLGTFAEVTVGGYISDEKTTYYTLQDIRYVAAGPAPLFPLQFIGNDPVRSKSKAAFATAILTPVENLTLTVGGRYTHESKDYTFFRYNLDGKTINAFVDPVGAANGAGYNGPNGIALTGRTGSYSGNRFDYRASVDYRFTPEIMAYATISTGFKGGGVAPRPFNALQAVPFGPEKLTAYEVGFKTDLFDRKLRFNVSAYFNSFKDAQLTLLSCPQFGGPGPCAVPQNAGDADVKGIEFELFLRPMAGLQIDASASLLDWKWKCVVPAVVNPAGATSGCSTDPALVRQLASPPRGVSKAQWSVGMQYEADLGTSGSLTPRIDVAYQGALAGTATTPVAGTPSALYARTDSYTLANARLTWKNADKDLDVSLEVTNLFDKYYFLAKFDLTGAGAGTISGMPGRPREWAVTVKKKF